MKGLKVLSEIHADVGIPVLLGIIIGIVVSSENGYVVRQNGEFVGINVVLWAVGVAALLMLWGYGKWTRKKLKAEIKKEILAEIMDLESRDD